MENVDSFRKMEWNENGKMDEIGEIYLKFNFCAEFFKAQLFSSN